MKVSPKWVLWSTAVVAVPMAARAQDGQDPSPTVDQRLEALEAENAELKRRIDVVAGEVERVSLKDLLAPPADVSINGLGPAASKIYRKEQGLSIGGYGEFLYSNPQGGADTFDALRGVLYFGYKFNDKWLFNSEIEIEHATTSSNSNGQSGSVSLEFAYVDYAWREALGGRGGLLLTPMGFINELHEPVTFLSARRPRSETVIIPTTWRENGVGAYGAANGFAYRSYVQTSLVADEFSAGGLRSGREKGNRAEASTWSWVTRVDWTDTPGLLAGGSVLVGNTGQDSGVSVPTQMYDLHLEWKRWGVHFRALGTMANLQNVSELNGLLGLTGTDSVGERLVGAYVELGYDVFSQLSTGEHQLTPFFRYESVDTQDKVPDGFASDPANDNDILTMGLAYQPIPSLIFKLDYEDWDNGANTATDQWNFAIGYIF